MAKLYITLWLRWVARVSLCSIISALSVSLLIMLFLYIRQGMPILSSEVVDALVDITIFWFPIIWSITLLVALFRSLKYVFNSCYGDYKLQLLTCDSAELIEVIGYGDLVKVWRKWFMVIIWLVGTQMVLSTAFTYLVLDVEGVFSWFNIYWLYGFVLSSGYLSFILLTNRCKRVRITRC